MFGRMRRTIVREKKAIPVLRYSSSGKIKGVRRPKEASGATEEMVLLSPTQRTAWGELGRGGGVSGEGSYKTSGGQKRGTDPGHY